MISSNVPAEPIGRRSADQNPVLGTNCSTVEVVDSLHKGLLLLVIVCLFWYTKNMNFDEKKLLANFGSGQQISAGERSSSA